MKKQDLLPLSVEALTHKCWNSRDPQGWVTMQSRVRCIDGQEYKMSITIEAVDDAA